MTRDAVGEAERLLEAGDYGRMLAFVLTTTEAEREEMRPLSRAWLRKAPPGRRAVRNQRIWTHLEHGQTQASLTLALAVLTWSDVSKLGQVVWLRAHYVLRHLVPALRPTWIGLAVDRLLEAEPTFFGVVWRWVQDGILPRPTSETWIRAGVNAVAGLSQLERLRTDPEAELAESLRRMMLTSGRLHHGPFLQHSCGGWSDALLTLVDEGTADHERLLRTALAAMLRDAPPSEFTFLLPFAEGLLRNDDDRARHKPALTALLCAPNLRARGFGVDQLARLQRRDPLGADVLVALGPALIAPQKGVARAAAKLMAAIAARPGVDPLALAEAVAAAACSPFAEVQRVGARFDAERPKTQAPPRRWSPAAPKPATMLDESRRIPPITAVDELVAVWTRLIERDDPEETERLLDAAVRLAPQRDGLGVHAGPLLQRCRAATARPERLPFLRYPLACFALTWFANESAPAPDWNWAEDPRKPLLERWDWLCTLANGPIDPFVAARLRCVAAMVEAGHGLGCLAAPTHRGARLSPVDAVARVAAWEAAGAEPPEAEVVLMLSRLAPVGRSDAQADAARLRSGAGRALQLALGRTAALDDLPAAVQIAAARCTGATVAALATSHGLPDAACPATVRFLPLSAAPHLRIEVSSAAPWSPYRRAVTHRQEPPEPLAHDPDGALAAAPVFFFSGNRPMDLAPKRVLFLAANLWTSGWMGHLPFASPWDAADVEPYRLWATLRSQDLEPFFAVGAVRLAALAGGENLARGNAAFLEPLLDVFVPLGECALWALTVGLGCRPPELRLLAIDALRVVADDGRLTLDHVDGVGARVAALWRTMPAARFVASLLDVGGPLGLAVLEAALRHSEGPAKGWTDVLEAWAVLLEGAPGDAELCTRMAAWQLPRPAKEALGRVCAGGASTAGPPILGRSATARRTARRR